MRADDRAVEHSVTSGRTAPWRAGGDRGSASTSLPGLVVVAATGVLMFGVVLSGSGEAFFVLALLAVPVAVVAGVWLQHRRVQAVRAWAARIGWVYVGGDHSLTRRWRGQPFGVGESRRASEVVTGTFGSRTATSFRYQYTSGSGKNRSTSVFHVVSLALPTFLPTVELTPQGLGARIAKALGAQDLTFESSAFNDAWRVAAPDPRIAHDLLHPRLMERLLRPDARGLSIRVEGTDILCWSPGQPDLDVVATRLGVLQAVVDAVPRYLWLDHGYDPSRT